MASLAGAETRHRPNGRLTTSSASSSAKPVSCTSLYLRNCVLFTRGRGGPPGAGSGEYPGRSGSRKRNRAEGVPVAEPGAVDEGEGVSARALAWHPATAVAGGCCCRPPVSCCVAHPGHCAFTACSLKGRLCRRCVLQANASRVRKEPRREPSGEQQAVEPATLSRGAGAEGAGRDRGRDRDPEAVPGGERERTKDRDGGRDRERGRSRDRVEGRGVDKKLDVERGRDGEGDRDRERGPGAERLPKDDGPKRETRWVGRTLEVGG